jgi:hypothetical protein
MATGTEVLRMLRPNGGWVIYGDDFDGIQFLECEPLTKKEFEDGFAKVDAWKAEEQAKAQVKKSEAEAKLAALGLSLEDLKALGLG